MSTGRWKPTARRFWLAVGMLAVTGLAGWVVGVLLPQGGSSLALADDDGWPPKIDANRAMDGDNEVGEILVNDEVVLRLYAATRELTPYERAVVVAERLKLHMAPQDEMRVAAGLRNGSHAVLVNDAVLVTPLPDDLPPDMSLRDGAQMWAEWLAEALGLEPAPSELAEPWEPAEPYDDKIVPILSLGSGQRIGGARVNGPESAVRQVQAVAQIEARLLRYFEVQIYVPISTKVPGKTLDRVEGVAVTAVGDLRL
jgi:hypothetical protein